MGTTALVNVTDTATLIIPANVRRASFYILNNGLNQMYIGENSSITTATGFPLAAASQLSEDRGENLWKGDVYGICAIADSPIESRYWERTHSG